MTASRATPVFTGQPVSRESLLSILNVAVWAPNHHLREPWQFVYVDGAATEEYVQGMTRWRSGQPGAESPDGAGLPPAPAYLIVTVKISDKPKVMQEDEAAVWCLIQNLKLLAEEQDIGIRPEPSLDWNAEGFTAWAGTAAGERIVAVLGIGQCSRRAAASSQAARTIRERRTVRSFTEQPVEAAVVQRLLRDSLPEASLRQGWRFIEAGSHEERSRMTDLMMASIKDMLTYKLMPGKVKNIFWKRTYSIPFNLVAVLDRERPPLEWSAEFGAMCSTLQNFQLAAWEEGIGMTWSSSDILDNVDFCAGMGLKPSEKIVAILHMGYTAKVPKGKPRTPAEHKLRFW
ncbi:nitroreductase family protein [Paenibacillus donghaensis]|uniref:Nitroreductase domain-containing protein n=1 Tax=Paenibacillus donghaensis TaxID=414771 RepID=A0A2Z2KBP6_9BACL|nr:nitroreductase family protein [Paenibacillus donghaensis]ASA20410.1 hypothetical protein B9T62_06095 [Paenibacillus donghaensis]